MQCYTELIAPTAVTHAVALPFLAPNANNLVVAKTSLLQVFTVKHTLDGAKSNLVLIGEYSLSGTVTALASIGALNTPSGGDAVLVAFKDAKLSLIEWDPENYRISTVSIHYYEGDSVIHQPFGPSLSECQVILTVDPSSRCAALKFGARHLAILPFRQLGDDLAEGIDDGDVDMDAAGSGMKRAQSQPESGEEVTRQTPYKSSFILPLTVLDPALVHTVYLAFLDEYREPTFGFLSSSIQPSSALLADRKDCLHYTVLTLDLDQRASTNLVTVARLPSDLWKIVPLALPVGGALLVGNDELVHVDQGGKTIALAVNEFAHQASDFNMIDQSSLNMKLENCEISVLDRKTGDLLIVLSDSSLAILSFKLLGRSVGGLIVTRVPAEFGGASLESAPSAIASMSNNGLFIGSEDGESTLVAWNKQKISVDKKRSHAQMIEEDVAVEDTGEADEVDEDDLYATALDHTERATSPTAQGAVDSALIYSFKVCDVLRSLGPVNNICLGKSPSHDEKKMQLVAAIGRGKASRLACLNRDVSLVAGITTAFADAKLVWSVSVQSGAGNQSPSKGGEDYDNLLFVFDGKSTKVFDIRKSPEDSNIYVERVGTEFEHDGETVAVTVLANRKTIVQCRRTEVRTYNMELNLSSIIPMYAEDGDAELRIVATSFWDQYLLVLRDDSSIQVLKFDNDGDAEPLVEDDSAIAQQKWLSGCIHSSLVSEDEPCVYLLGHEGGLHIFSIPDLKLCYQAPSLTQLPPVLSADRSVRRGGGKATLVELLVTNLGVEDHAQPYLIVRTSLDDLTLYEPFHHNVTTKTVSAEYAALRFRKVPCQHLPKYDETLENTEDGRPAALQALRLAGLNVVYIPGASPSILVKDMTNLPKIISIRVSKVQSMTALHHIGCEKGLAFVNSDSMLGEYTLPLDTWYGSGWSVSFVMIGEPAEEVRHVAFHGERDVYVVATCRDVDFLFDDDDGRHTDQEDLVMRPQIPQYTIHLFSAHTRTVVSSFEMPYTEQVTSLKVMNLESSELTHEEKSFVVIGTGSQRGEDMPGKGAVTVFDIIDVVPKPEHPETGIALHIFAREETKGAVTAVETFPGGLVGIVQGQKVMIRGLKEDGSCLPVAFLDALCYMNTLKSLGTSGLWMLGDVWKGLWFGGFTQEPYKLSPLGKSQTQMEVVVADFLPFDQQLYIVVIDADMTLHVLQYDPENPKSISGTRLLERSTFHLGQFPTTMTLVPSTLAPFAQQKFSNGDYEPATLDNPESQPFYHVLTTTQTGSIGLITPLDETTYRRLGALQTQLSSILEHAAGLNPRAFRTAADVDGTGARGGVIDGNLIQRIAELGSQKCNEVLGRAGGDVWGMRSDLEIIGGGGLGYL